jgi:hypothetical protein
MGTEPHPDRKIMTKLNNANKGAEKVIFIKNSIICDFGTQNPFALIKI